MEKIKSVSALPDWFRNRTYRRQLTDVEWFREIRRREWVTHMRSIRGTLMEQPAATDSGTFTELMLNILTGVTNIVPNSSLYYVSQHGEPVRDLDSDEAIFLGFTVHQRDDNKFAKEYERLLTSWCATIKRIEESDVKPLTYGLYDVELADFVNLLDGERAKWFDSPCFNYNDDRIGNPWLSYGRPLNGHPVTIDTQFDDDTIIKHFKIWLSEKRRAEGMLARRPYNQNDFKDWEYYKIREIFDLETWAALTNVKILDNVIASALWPDAPDNFSPIDVLRTTARKKTKEVFRYETSVRLWGQLLLTYGEKFLDK